MTDASATPPKKKGKLVKLLGLVLGVLVLVGGGVGAGLYAAGGVHGGPANNDPKLVPKSEQKHVGEGGDHGGSGGGSEGGDKYASNYYAFDKEFTSNLQDSTHYIQVGIAVSTPYDDKVIQNLKDNEIAVRSSVLMALGDTTEDQVFTSQGKRQLQAHLADAINDVLKQKEGFGGVGNVYFTSFVVQ